MAAAVISPLNTINPKGRLLSFVIFSGYRITPDTTKIAGLILLALFSAGLFMAFSFPVQSSYFPKIICILDTGFSWAPAPKRSGSPAILFGDAKILAECRVAVIFILNKLRGLLRVPGAILVFS